MTRKLFIIAAVLVLSACEQVAVNTASTPAPIQSQEQALRVLVPAEGLASLYDQAQPNGLPLAGAVEVVAQSGDIEVRLGPLNQNLVINERSAVSVANTVETDNIADNATIFVPVRIIDGIDSKICRFELRTPRLSVSAMSMVTEDEKGERFTVPDLPVVALLNATVSPIGDCEVPTLDFGAETPTFEDSLRAYVSRSLAESAQTAFETNPSEILGLMTRRIRLDHLSAYPNRTSSLRLEGSVQDFKVDEAGLEVQLAIGSDIDTAECAPPIALGGVVAGQTAAIEPDLVSEFGADFAMAVSATVIDRLGKSLALGGYACSGLEDVRRPSENEELVASSDLLLDEIMLSDVPLGPWAQVVATPGSLPDVTTRPQSGQLQLDWEDLTLDVYGTVLGTRVKILELTTSASANLRPAQGPSGVVRFDLESIELASATLESEWLTEQPAQSAVDQWARRVLLLVLADQFVFPLPVEPGTPLQVTGTQVRTDDIVLYLRFQ